MREKRERATVCRIIEQQKKNIRTKIGMQTSYEAEMTTGTPSTTSAPLVKVKSLRAPPKREQDPHRLAQRQKQIDYGKKTAGYIRYRQLVEKSQRKPARRAHKREKDGSERNEISRHVRQKEGRHDMFGHKSVEVVEEGEVVVEEEEEEEDPQTPNIYQVCSKRSFDGQVRKWRRLLHKWDDIVAGDDATGRNIMENDALKRKRVDGDDEDYNENTIGNKNERTIFRCDDIRIQDKDKSRQCINLADMSNARPNGTRLEGTLNKRLCQRGAAQQSDMVGCVESDEDEDPVVLRPSEIHKVVDSAGKIAPVNINRDEISESICKKNDCERYDRYDKLSVPLDGKKEDASIIAANEGKISLDIYADWDSDWDSDEFDPDSVGDVETLRKLTQPSL